jgi:hypothetical protein
MEIKANTAVGSGMFSIKNYFAGEIVLTEKEWYADLTEDWITLSVAEILALDEPKREAFLKYSFDLGFGQTKGTFSESALQNPANFINHSCDPNTEFDGEDNLIARRSVISGEELTIDYGTFVVNFDQSFLCECGQGNCRKTIRKEDWKFLANSTLTNLAKFIRLSIP